MRIALFAIAVACAPLQAHQGNTNLAAGEACAEQVLGDACEWIDSHEARYMGSCRKISSSLTCVRNKPIVYAEGESAHTHKGAQ